MSDSAKAKADMERLEDELEMMRAMVPLEEAREAMHKKRTKETIAAYKEASAAAVEVRQRFREKYPPEQKSGKDGVAAPATVRSRSGVNP